MMYYHLQPPKPLYMVTGPLGTQIFGFKQDQKSIDAIFEDLMAFVADNLMLSFS